MINGKWFTAGFALVAGMALACAYPALVGADSNAPTLTVNVTAGNATAIKNATAGGTLVALKIRNNFDGPVFLEVFDASDSAAVQLGTSSAKISLPIASASVGGGTADLYGPINFGIGIQAACVTTRKGTATKSCDVFAVYQ